MHLCSLANLKIAWKGMIPGRTCKVCCILFQLIPARHGVGHLNYRAHVDLASVEVRFDHLSINAEVAVGARGEPTVLNAYRNKFEVPLPVST